MNEHRKTTIGIYAVGFLISATILLGTIDKHILNPLDELNYSKEKINQYSYYVEELPVPDIWNMTTVEKSFDRWTEKNPEIEFYQVNYKHDADIVITWEKQLLAQDGDNVGGLHSRYHDGVIFGVPRNFITVDYVEECGNDVVHHKSKYRIENVITHEIGHALGLDHTSDPSSIMYASDGDDNFDSMGLTIPKDVYLLEEYYSHEEQMLSKIIQSINDLHENYNELGLNGTEFNQMRTELTQEHDRLNKELKCTPVELEAKP